MAENSGIEWTDSTFNPWMGCTKVSPACKNCYAERDFDHRYGQVKWGPVGTRVKTSVANWKKPQKWNRDAEKSGKRLRVFCASLADVFEDWTGPILDHNGNQLTNATFETASPSSRPLTMDDLRKDLFALIDATPHLDWLLLTKRPENIERMWFDPDSLDGFPYRKNVWLGTSVENQEWANNRVPDLLDCRHLASKLFLSCEPLVGEVDLRCVEKDRIVFDSLTGEFETVKGTEESNKRIDWVITGGESGPAARPAHIDWYRNLRDQCRETGTPFHFKQWGEWYPIHGTGRPAEDEENEFEPFMWVDQNGNQTRSGAESD